MSEEITIPIQWLLGTLIIILSALVGAVIKNMRDNAKITSCIKNIEKWITNHGKETDDALRRLREAERDIAHLQP